MNIVTDAGEEILATFNLCLIGPPPSSRAVAREVFPIVRAGIAETEENLTDLLPEGYRIQIKEWCDE